LLCNSSCLTCSNGSSCNTCTSQFYLLPANLNVGVTTCVTSCPLGYYPKSIVQISFQNSTLSAVIQQQCTICISPCLTCKSASICTDCIANYTLSGTTCIQNCPAGSYKSINIVIQILSVSITTTTCKLCSSVCATCVNSSNYCLSCYNGYILTSTNDCVSNCSSSTTYYNNVTRVCSNCSVDCFTCYGPTSSNCLSCKPPLQLYLGSCNTICPFSFYASPLYKCEPCASACASCYISASNCTSCNLPSSLQITNGIGNCVLSCSSGYFLNQSTSICQRCNINCLTCYGGSLN